MIKLKTKGTIISMNKKNIATIKASQTDTDEFVPIIDTQDYKTIEVDLDTAPFNTPADCLTAIKDYIDNGGEQ